MIDLNLLKELTEAPGISGCEAEVRKIVSRAFTSICQTVDVDRLGNVIGRIPGSGPKLALTAHMDEVGMMVSKIDDSGFIRVMPVGDLEARNCFSQMVLVHGKEKLRCATGVFPQTGAAQGNPGKPVDWDAIVIDPGMDAERVRSLIKVGDPVTFDALWHETPDTVFSKAFDDRVGIFAMIEAVKRAASINCDLYLIATVQEEVGLKGIGPAINEVSPDILITLEGTFCPDTPNDKVPANLTPTCMGRGPEIRIKDREMISDRCVVDWIASLAEAAQIPHQRSVKNFGNTDASRAQITGKGTRTVVISMPVRYLHSPVCVISKADLIHMIQMVSLCLEKADLFFA